jgi:hypothetical protein
VSLTDEQQKQIEAMAAQHGRIGHVEHDGHLMVFRAPDGIQVRDFKRKAFTQEKVDRIDQLCQQIIVCFDGETDPLKARLLFGSFLAEYPLFEDNPRLQTILSVMVGVVAEEDAQVLGKGCGIWRRIPKPSKQPLVDGSAATTTKTPASRATS